MLDTYLAWQAANRNTIVAAEKKFQFPLNGRKVKGFIDRIEQTPEGEYVVVDFKTGAKPSSLTKNSVPADIQLNLYSLAIKEMFGKLPTACILLLHQGRQDGRLFPDRRDRRGICRNSHIYHLRSLCGAVRSNTIVPDLQVLRLCGFVLGE